MTDLAQQRALARHLLDERSAADAMAAYYALEHAASRTRLFLHYADGGRVDGVLVRSQTGADLFRPLVILRAPDPKAAVQLLHAGFGLGVERTVAWICGLEHIREASPYPRMLQRNTP